MPLPTHDDVLAARARIAAHVTRTPMLRHPLLDQIAGGPVLVKAEPLQRTGSFKLRGATNAIRTLGAGALGRGVVTFSSGNHGQAVACAASAFGVRATVIMPTDAPRIKMDSTRRWGATIVQYDRRHGDRDAIARELVDRTGAALVPPFDHPDVIAGQGTLALELAEDAAGAGLPIAALLVCTGGGGLVAGCALALEGVSPRTAVYAVEPAGWDDTARSLASGLRETNGGGGSGLCDALLARQPGEITFAVNQPRLAGGIVVTDDEVLAAIAWAFSHLKVVVEPGGAVCLAAVLAGKAPGWDGASGAAIGIVLSGGNVDPAVFTRALAA